MAGFGSLTFYIFSFFYFFFFFNDTATTEIYTLSLHDALPICHRYRRDRRTRADGAHPAPRGSRRRRRRHLLAAFHPHAFARFVFLADSAQQRAPDLGRCATGDFWPGAGRHDVSNAAGGGRACQQYGLWLGGERLEREHQRFAAHRSTTQSGCGLGERHESLRCCVWFWRVSRERIWTRGRR